MKFQVCCFSALIYAALLSACAVNSGAGPRALRANAFRERTITNAYGYVVDDPSGRPLSEIKVRLEPWDRGCFRTGRKTARCPAYLRYRATTDKRGRFELLGVPNGDYLLVIGTDSPSDLGRPTVHDHVHFTGGLQRLRAPTLPTIPCDAANYMEWCQGVRPSPDATPYPRPEVEKMGNYRLTTINRIAEEPCIVAFNGERAKLQLPSTVVDEWLTENTREIASYRLSRKSWIPQPTPYLTAGNLLVVGGDPCSGNTLFFPPTTFVGNWQRNPALLWFAGLWKGQSNGAEALLEFPLDPRSFVDPTEGSWP